jgi:undecaprenyl-diphosphatase
MTSDANHLPDLETTPKPTILIETTTIISLVVAVLALFLFAWIAESVADQHTQRFDLLIRTGIHQHASPAFTRVMIWTSFLGGDGLALAALLAFGLFIFYRWRRAALWLVITLAGATVLDLTLKHAFHRARPEPYFVPLPHSYSFPSGHALYSFCFYGVLAALIAGRIRSLPLRILLWAVAALLVFAIGLSRVYLGVHYPSDVIAGYLAAAIWVATLVVLDRLHKNRKSRVAK